MLLVVVLLVLLGLLVLLVVVVKPLASVCLPPLLMLTFSFLPLPLSSLSFSSFLSSVALCASPPLPLLFLLPLLVFALLSSCSVSVALLGFLAAPAAFAKQSLALALRPLLSAALLAAFAAVHSSQCCCHCCYLLKPVFSRRCPQEPRTAAAKLCCVGFRAFSSSAQCCCCCCCSLLGQRPSGGACTGPGRCPRSRAAAAPWAA